MILSILDTDLYKFSTSNAYFHLYPLAEGTFKFNDRAAEVIAFCNERGISYHIKDGTITE